MALVLRRGRACSSTRAWARTSTPRSTKSLRTRADDLAAVAGGRSSAPPTGDRLVESDESLAQVHRRGRERRLREPGPRPRAAARLGRAARARGAAPSSSTATRVPGFDERVRLLARPAGDRIVVVGATREDREEALVSLGSVLLIGGPIALLLAALAGYGVATAALRPVAAMRGEAAEISRLGSGRRLPVPPGGDELAELGGTLNEMLDAPRALGRARARLRGEREPRAAHAAGAPEGGAGARAARGPRPPRSCARRSRPPPSESDRLVQLAEDLLVLARADEGRLPVRPERLDVAELLATTARRFEARAARGGARAAGERGATGSPLQPTACARSRRWPTSWTTRSATATAPSSWRRAGRRRVRLHVLRPRPRLRRLARRPRVRALHARRPGALARRHRARPGDRRRDRALARRARGHGAARGRRRRRLDRAAGLSRCFIRGTRTDAMKIKRKHIAVGGAVLAAERRRRWCRRRGGRERGRQGAGERSGRRQGARGRARPSPRHRERRRARLENGGTWEVEITGEDGKTVDVRLDENYEVLMVEGDGENDSENEGGE